MRDYGDMDFLTEQSKLKFRESIVQSLHKFTALELRQFTDWQDRETETNAVVQFHQSWSERLDVPPTKILERYLRNQLAVALEIHCQIDGSEFGMCALIVCNKGTHLGSEFPRPRRDAQNEFSVLIDTVEVMDNVDKSIDRIDSVIWLEQFDKSEGVGVCDSLYFSFVSGNAVFIDRPFLENRKFDTPRVFFPMFGGGKLPDYVIQTGSQVVDNLPGEHAESWWNHAVCMVLDSLKQQLRVVFWKDCVFAFVKECGEFRLQVTDVFVGPF